ncbi:hypothetical protein [Arthrobacter glacialis]|uniref:Plasmid replication protein n=1 Tax=Arthrobacter glacialis TaxID=1664 RepID=A0A2S4A1X1_ARTGL|nr:hypothetical protein [Arthrobacter glacialis]POH75192.1 hypothetical protein CVS27_00845 [Arthrobacter glacialis]
MARTFKKVPTTERRHRGFSIVSDFLTCEDLQRFITENPTADVVAMVHDADPGRKTHGHLFVYFRGTPQTKSAVLRKFRKAVQVILYIEHYEPGKPHTGKHALTRAARYLTHEHPNEQAKGKHRYGDDEMLYSTRCQRWRAEVDALNQLDGIDPEKATKTTLVERLARQVLSGVLTERQVKTDYTSLYLAKGPSYWERLERRFKKFAADDAEAANHNALREERERAAREASIRAAQEELDQQAQAAAEQLQHEADKAAQEDEARSRSQAERELHESPEYKTQQRFEEEETERRNMVVVIAMAIGYSGPASGRERAVAKHIQDAGFASKKYGPDENLTAEDARVFLIDDYGLQGTPEEQLAQMLEDVELEMEFFKRVQHRIHIAEFHAGADDASSVDAYLSSLSLRDQCQGFEDLVRLASPRADIPKSVIAAATKDLEKGAAGVAGYKAEAEHAATAEAKAA